MAPAVKFAEALKTDLTKQQAQPTGSRHFTGDSNRGLSKDMEASASSRQGSGTAGSASSKPVTMPTFTAGAASVPVSPSKKRLHRHIKLPQAAAPSGNAPAPKANPFAAHGLTDAAAKATAPSKGSPGKPQQGRTSPINSHRHTVRPNSGVQGMHIDTPVQAAKPTAQPNVFNTTQPTSTKNSASTSTFMGFCGGTAAAVKQQAINQKLNHPGSSFTLGQQAAKAQHAGHRQQGSKQSEKQPQAANPFTAAGLQHNPSHAAPAVPDKQPSDTANHAPSVPLSPPSMRAASTAKPAASAPNTSSFQFGVSQAATSSPQLKFSGFNTSKQTQASSHAFAGFAAGTAGTAKTPVSASRRSGCRPKAMSGPRTPADTPMSATSNGAAGSPMDMDTPFFPGSSQATAASPLQQPKFTPSWKTSPTAAGTSSAFKAGQDEAAPRQAAPSGQSSFMFSSTFEPSATPDPQGPVIDDDNDDPQSGANNQHQMPAQPNQQPKSHTHTTQPMGAKAAANPFPFFAANRPMDSRIPEACANSFMGIHLSNSPPKPFAATAPAAEPVTQAASHAQTAAGCTVNFAQGAPSDPTRPDATAAAADSSHAAPPSFSFGTGFAKSTAQTGAAEAPSAKASAAFAFGAGATSQSANVSFTPGVQRASKQTPKDRTSRIIHDPFQLHGNIRTQLNLEDQFTAQAPAATRSSEPVIDLTKAHRTQRQSTHSRSSASAQPAQPSGQTQESASSQTSQAPFVFGSGKPAGPTHFASTAASGTNATSSQAQSQKPFVFGATSNAPAPAAFPTAFGAQPQQPNQPKASWPPQPAVPPRKPSMFSSATAVPGPQPGTASTQQSAHASGNGLATDGSPAKEAFTIGLSSPGIAKSKHSAAHSGRPAFSMHGRKTPGKSRLSRQAQPGCNDLTGEGVEKLSKLRPVDVDLTTDSDPVQQRQPAGSSNQLPTVKQEQQPAWGQAPSQAQQAHARSRSQRLSPGAHHRVSQQEKLRRVDAMAEQLRQQANVAYTESDYTGAGRLYTQALNVLSQAGIITGDTYVRLLTNRAACLLALHQPLPALQDCQRAVQADPANVRAATRAATCHLKMGDLDEAAKTLNAVRATLPNSQALPDDLANKQRDLEQTKLLITEATSKLASATTVGAVAAAHVQLESLSWEGGFCPYSQYLLALTAQALLRLQRFDDAVKLAEKNTNPLQDRPSALHWPWWVRAQVHFFKGDLAQAQQWLQQGMQKLEAHPEHQEAVPLLDELAEMQHTIRNLLQLKEDGNKAVQTKHWQHAIAKYTDAISGYTIVPPAFAAVLHCNRAAAYQGAGQHAEAIADSLRSRALDPSYCKAYSRLAAVLASLQMSSAVVVALEQLQDVCKTQKLPDTHKTAARLVEARRDVQRRQPVHHYRLLGLPQSCAVDEVRKAYKKSSLRFHPDKAMTHCKFAFSLGPKGAALANRSDIESRVREEANWLFKCISEACNVLSDSQQRRELDAALTLEERHMFYRNDLTTPPGGVYSFQRPNRAKAPANYRPQPSYKQSSSRTSSHPGQHYWWHETRQESDDSEDDAFASNADYGSNFY